MKFGQFSVGETYITKEVKLTEDDIINFAKIYDPQYFHIDEEAAKQSPYQSIIASGFQTLSVIWAEWIKMDILGHECLGGIGANIRWTKPVVPNDRLFGKITVNEKYPSSDGKRGRIIFGISIFNQEKLEVLNGQTEVYIANE